MSFYDLNKEDRMKMVNTIHQQILSDLKSHSTKSCILYFSDEDTYIRKAAYLAIGKIHKVNVDLKEEILNLLNELFESKNEKIRQTVINAAGEIGILNFPPIEHFMEQGLSDPHHSVRNAVIGLLKKMGEKNPLPVLSFSKKFLHHPNPEIRREICHGLELRGRTHPQDILPLLKELQHEKKARIRNTLIHVLGQIAYKKGCLAIVVNDLKNWDNKEVVMEAFKEIIDVHDRYKNFSELSQAEAIVFIQQFFPQL